MPALPESLEPELLRARARGDLSCDQAFERLYGAYARNVIAWLAVRVTREDVDDLAQDVWSVFYRRWRGWQMLPEMEAPGARPVLSFLYRTTQFVVQAYRRRPSRRDRALDDAQEPLALSAAPERLLRDVELGRCLDIARRLCPVEELDVLVGKLSGVPAAEIARTHGITEPVVDHRFRNAIARIKKELRPRGRPTPNRHG